MEVAPHRSPLKRNFKGTFQKKNFFFCHFCKANEANLWFATQAPSTESTRLTSPGSCSLILHFSIILFPLFIYFSLSVMFLKYFKHQQPIFWPQRGDKPWKQMTFHHSLSWNSDIISIIHLESFFLIRDKCQSDIHKHMFVWHLVLVR